MKVWLFVSLLLFVGCLSDDKASVLNIGTVMKETSRGLPEVTGGTNFTTSDTLHFALSSQKPFQESSLTFQIINGAEEGDYGLLTQTFSLQPGDKYVTGHFLASELIHRFGYGSFKARFLLGEKVLAEKAFALTH